MREGRFLDLEMTATAEAARQVGLTYLAERAFENEPLLRVQYRDVTGAYEFVDILPREGPE